MRQKTLTKSISLPEGSGQVETFKEAIRVFSNFNNISESKAIFELVILGILPKNLYKREELEYLLRNHDDSAFANVLSVPFERYIGLAYITRDEEELAQLEGEAYKTLDLINQMSLYTLNRKFCSNDHVPYIANQLRYVCDDIKRFNHQRDSEDTKKRLFNLFLNFEKEWKVDPCPFLLRQIIMSIAGGWNFFKDFPEAVKIISVGLQMCYIPYTADNFMKLLEFYKNYS